MAGKVYSIISKNTSKRNQENPHLTVSNQASSNILYQAEHIQKHTIIVRFCFEGNIMRVGDEPSVCIPFCPFLYWQYG